MTIDEGHVDWNPTAAVWTSLDGLTWSRVPHDDEEFARPDGRGAFSMSSVTRMGAGLVAVGSQMLGDDVPTGRATDTAVWTSPDGVTWSRVPHDDEVFGRRGNQRMHDVTATATGLVAVGVDVQGDTSRYYTSQTALVWTSVDGQKWTRVAPDEGVFGGGAMVSVTVAGTGLVAVGQEPPPEIVSGGPPETGNSSFVWIARPTATAEN